MLISSTQVISGYQIPKPRDSKKGEVIDPFLKIEVYGVKSDTQNVKTSVIDNNGKALCLLLLVINRIYYNILVSALQYGLRSQYNKIIKDTQ